MKIQPIHVSDGQNKAILRIVEKHLTRIHGRPIKLEETRSSKQKKAQ